MRLAQIVWIDVVLPVAGGTSAQIPRSAIVIRRRLVCAVARLLHMSSVDSQGTYEEDGYVIGQPDNRTWLYYSTAGNCQGDAYLYSSANHVHWWKTAGAQFSSWWSTPALYILFYN